MAKKIVNEYSQAVFNLPWLVAQEEGYFAEEGLEVEYIILAGVPPELGPLGPDDFRLSRLR